MLSIALIGANSFLAKELILYFNKNSCKLSLYAREKQDHINASHNFVKFEYPDLPIIFDELLNFDVILYTAAAGVQANKNEEFKVIYDINFYLPFQIVSYLNNNSYKGKFISFGSYFEIGNNQDQTPYTEEDIVFSKNNIPNAYCDSKRLLSRYYINRQYNINWFHLILPSLYGNTENKDRLIPYLVSSLKSGLQPKTSSGIQLRQYLHVTDLVSLLDILIKSDIAADIYNVAGSNKSLPVIEIIKYIHKLFDISFQPSEPIGKRDENMLVLNIDGSKLNKAVPQWQSKIDIYEGIKTYC